MDGVGVRYLLISRFWVQYHAVRSTHCEPQHRNDAIPQVFPRLRDRACTPAAQWDMTEFATHYPLLRRLQLTSLRLP